MSRARVHNFSISLDGFATGDGLTAEEPFGHASLWDGLEGLEQTYEVESVSTPSGVTHLTFTR